MNWITKTLLSFKKFFTLRHIVYANYENETMTIKWSDGETEKYNGECTVWAKEPFMERCDTHTVTMLLSLWKYCRKYKGSYPDAHPKI